MFLKLKNHPHVDKTLFSTVGWLTWLSSSFVFGWLKINLVACSHLACVSSQAWNDQTELLKPVIHFIFKLDHKKLIFFYTNNKNSTQVLNGEIQPHSLKNKWSFAYSKRLRFKTIMLDNTMAHNQDNANVFVNQPEWVYYCPIALNV